MFGGASHPTGERNDRQRRSRKNHDRIGVREFEYGGDGDENQQQVQQVLGRE